MVGDDGSEDDSPYKLDDNETRKHLLTRKLTGSPDRSVSPINCASPPAKRQRASAFTIASLLSLTESPKSPYLPLQLEANILSPVPIQTLQSSPNISPMLNPFIQPNSDNSSSPPLHHAVQSDLHDDHNGSSSKQ